MTDGHCDILLLADDAAAAEVAVAAPGPMEHRREAYEAIAEFARRPYRSVLLTHPRADFAGLVRAFRRIRPTAGAYALCSPAGEAELQMSGAGDLDDYFVYPPSAEDMAAVVRGRGAAAAVEGGGAALSPEEIAELVEAAGTMEDLARHVRERVAQWTGMDLQWVEASDPRAASGRLLLMDEDLPMVLVGQGETPSAALRERLRSLQVLLGALAGAARRTEALHRLAITDHLTGAYNRRYFYHFTDELLERARRERFRVTLLLYDIDNFKRYNDTYGHAAGDDILRETARLMKHTTRGHDIVARIGGDEFTVLFWDAGPTRQPDSSHPDSAYVLAQRFVDAVAKHEFSSLGPEARGVLTISGGLATFPWDGTTCRELLRQADKGLRLAKDSGKNAIYLVGSRNIRLEPGGGG